MRTKLKGRRAPSKSSTRVNLRIHPTVKSVLVRAAKLRLLKLTEFMIESSRVAAEMALADRSRFAVTDEKWRAFQEALDAPAKDVPGLRKLFREPSVFTNK